jgi:hypothetical protein
MQATLIVRTQAELEAHIETLILGIREALLAARTSGIFVEHPEDLQISGLLVSSLSVAQIDDITVKEATESTSTSVTPAFTTTSTSVTSASTTESTSVTSGGVTTSNVSESGSTVSSGETSSETQQANTSDSGKNITRTEGGGDNTTTDYNYL